MITLRTLGAVGLTGDDGHELDGLLRQPKRLALLCYLASPHPGSWHRRDTLLAAFWPELDTQGARTVLRNSLYVLRKELGPGILRTRGVDEVSLDPALLQSDVAQFQSAIREGHLATALALYAGDFLTGFYVVDAQGFEQWLDGERERLRALVCKAAAALSLQHERDGDLVKAAEVQRRLCELHPDDESAARRLMLLLDHVGDRGLALVIFGRLEARLRDEFDSEPSAETMRLVSEIRARSVPNGGESEQLAPARAPATMGAPPPTLSASPRASRRSRWWAAALVVGALAMAAAMRSRPHAAAKSDPTVLLVLPMENTTGSPDVDYIASGLAEDAATRLASLHTFTIRSAARAHWPATTRDSVARVADAFGASVMLRTRLLLVADSLQVEARLLDVATGVERYVSTPRFMPATLSAAGSRLAAAIAGTVFRVPLPASPRGATGSVDPEAFRLTMLGWHRLLGLGDTPGARDLFLQATRLDPLHPRAWSGLSSTWAAAATNGRIAFDEGRALADAAASRALALDSLEGTAWANLGVMRALEARSLAVAEPLFRRAIAVEPSNAEVYMIYASALRFAWQWERANDLLRIARELDPLSAFYPELAGNGSLCADRPEDALRWYRTAATLDARDRNVNIGITRALARLGRWDAAIAQLRLLARARGDTALAALDREAQGEAGYWRLKHREGEALLQARLAQAQGGWVAPYLIGVAQIGAGHLDRGLALLEAEVRAGSRMVYKLPCNAEIDEVRSLPRFQRLLTAAGALPLRR